MPRCDGLLYDNRQCRFKARPDSDFCKLHRWGRSWKVFEWEESLTAADKEKMVRAMKSHSIADQQTLWEHITIAGGNAPERKALIKQLSDTCFPGLLPTVWCFQQVGHIWHEVRWEAIHSRRWKNYMPWLGGSSQTESDSEFSSDSDEDDYSNDEEDEKE